MSVEKLIDELDELVSESMPLPLNRGKCIIDKEQIQLLIQELKESLPEELHQAQAVVEERANIIERAKREADDLMKRAQMQAKKLVSQEEIVRLAAGKAKEIVTLTNERSAEMKKNTAEYANSVLAALEESMTKNLAEVRKSRQQIKAILPNPPAQDAPQQPAEAPSLMNQE